MFRSITRRMVWATTVLSVASHCSVLRADDATKQIFRHTLDATAWVVSPTGQGTGFLVDRSQKLLVTNQHVVKNHDTVNVTFPIFEGGRAVSVRKYYAKYDRPIRGYVLARDPERDLAVVQLEVVPHAAATLLLSAASPRPGERVYLLGNPGATKKLWMENIGTIGRVGQESRKVEGSSRELHALIVGIKADAPVLPGCSGGPVVNGSGRLVGVITLSNDALPESERNRRVVAALIASGGCSPIHAVGCLSLLPPPNLHLAFCIDAREVEDVVRMVQTNNEKARRLLDPHSAADYRERGNYFCRKSRPNLANLAFDKAVRLDPRIDRAQILDTLAAAYAASGEFEEAARQQKKALRLAGANQKADFEFRLKIYERRSGSSGKSDECKSTTIRLGGG
jgi:V8-like Glu-specific endopeptidase